MLHSKLARAMVLCTFVIVAACDDSPSPTGSGMDNPGDPNASLECDRLGYPCTWGDVAPTILERSDQLGDEILQMFDAGQSAADALAWIESQSGVAETSGNQVAVRFRLAGGRPVWVLSQDAILIPDGAPAASPGPQLMASAAPVTDVVGDQPKAKRALVLSPYHYELGGWDPSPDIATLLSGTRGYEGRVDYHANTDTEIQVQLQHFTGWDGYDVIFMTTHGTQVCDGDDCHTMVAYSQRNNEVLLSETAAGIDVVKINYGEGKGPNRVGLSTDFFRQAYPGGLGETIVYISACQTSKGEDLAQALAGESGVFLGWTESVWADGARDAALAFFENLVEEGIPATSSFVEMRNGPEDLTIDRRLNNSGALATLAIQAPQNDLRIREVAYIQNPLTEKDLPTETPNPVVGQPEDGEPDKIPYMIKVDGVEGDPSGFTVHVDVNGFSGEPKPLSEGKMLDAEGNVWQVKGKVPVPFDAQQGQQVDVKVRVELPEGGASRWDEEPTLGNPALHFTSEIESEGGVDFIARIYGRVHTEYDLSMDEQLEKMQGDGTLEYQEYTVEANGTTCSITNTTTTDGTLRTVEALFPLEGENYGVPEEVVLIPLDDIKETYTATCSGTSTTQPTIHWYSGFISWHSGAIPCAPDNEADQSRGGFVISDFTAGSGDVIGRKVYDRSCDLNAVTFSETTTIELRAPDTGS